MINSLVQNPAFGVALTIIAYEFSKWIQRKTGLKILSPLLTGTAFIIAILYIGKIDYENYKKGASIISFLVGPATVSFAIPLYKNIKVIKENLYIILIGIVSGLVMGLISVFTLSTIFGINREVTLSMLPKSVTSAIGYAISDMIGGRAEITLVMIVVAGTTGYIFSDYIFKILKIDNPVIKGISLGTNSHIVGTAKAMELGEEEGALSSAAISVAGIIMVFLVPLFLRIIGF